MKQQFYAYGVALLLGAAFPFSSNAGSAYHHAYFQEKIITGKVTNANGEPLEGVTVTTRGATRSVVTDKDGNFRIGVPANARVLIVSFVGHTTQEVTIGSGTAFDIKMQPEDTSMEDVVVVGYGTQRRTSLTGAVSTVSGRVLTERPAPNSVNLLQGRAPGLQIIQNSGEPGRDAGSILIRGRSSFAQATSGPLILIDGVSGSLSNLSPDDIDNISVLKDASSAAIYGSRAANGVILVTTKKGKTGETVVNYRFNIGSHSPTSLPKFITNSADYMELFNSAVNNKRLSGSAPLYKPEQIAEYRNATDRDQFPNFDHIDYWFRPGLVTNHNLSVSGGNEKSQFNISGSYLNQEAMLPGYKFKRYNTLINYSVNINKAITLGTSMNLTYKDRFEPPFTSSNMMIAIFATSPTYGAYLPDGSGRIVTKAYAQQGTNRNPSEYYGMGWQRLKEYNFNGQAFMDIKLLKNLTWSNKVAINYVDEFLKMYQHSYTSYLLQERNATTGEYTVSNQYGADIPGVVDQYSKSITPTVYSTLNYNTEIGNGHNIRVLAGYEQISSNGQGLRARRINGVSQALTEIGAYTSTGEVLNQTHPRLPGLPSVGGYGLRSLFGRVNYEYLGKYLFEANIRRDETSRVSPEYRVGVFPSVSAGWVLSKENFMEQTASWLSSFKLRASYGTLGNQDISNYPYQDVLTIGTGSAYPFGNTPPTAGAVLSGFRDRSIQWESTRVTDVGFDMDIKNGLLGVTFDWFDKYTFNILSAASIPASIGLGAPTINNGKMRNRGIELALTHEYSVGEIRYGLNFQISTYRNKVLSIRVPSTTGQNIQKEGLPWNTYFMYLFDGIVQEGETPIPHSGVPAGLLPGDIKMKDVSGPEGKPDGRITTDDRVVIKGAMPDYAYSFGGHVDYKNLSFTFFFQGVQGVKARIANWGADPFYQGGAPTVEWYNAWTPQNKSNTMPGIYINGYTNMSAYSSSSNFWLRDASYLRLKNITLSYAFNKSVYSKIRASNLSVFVSADNLLTFTKFKNGDPERPNFSNGEMGNPSADFSQFPQARILNAGINVKF